MQWQRIFLLARRAQPRALRPLHPVLAMSSIAVAKKRSESEQAANY